MKVTPPTPPFAVVGLGQLGGGLARALGRSFPEAQLLALEVDPKARSQALQDRLVAQAEGAPGPWLGECGLIFLCVPIATLPDLLPALAPHLSPKAIVTDVSPVKGAIAAMVAEHLPGIRYVGGHPLVAGDPSGPGPARGDLFVGRPVALCPKAGEESLAASVGAVWAAIGARPVVISAEEHDRLIAATAHAPYLSALALARVAGALEGAERLIARSFGEAFRPAGLPPASMAAAVGHNPFAPAA
ncbi:MAG TPA: prephenate dehydrogenase/arogenate dehydrogenase family protein, partial [Vulgatibacter sp.]